MKRRSSSRSITIGILIGLMTWALIESLDWLQIWLLQNDRHGSLIPHEALVWFRFGGAAFSFAVGLIFYTTHERRSYYQQLAAASSLALIESERRSRENEERLSSIMASLRDVIWSGCPKTHKMLFLSPAAEALYGVPIQRLLDEPHLWLDFVHPDDHECVKGFSQRLRQEKNVRVKYRIVRPDGTIRWVADTGHAVFDDENNIVRFDGIVSDITEEVTAREQMHRAQQMMKDILDGAPLILNAVDDKGVFTVSEGRILEAIGQTPGQLVGELYFEIFEPGDPRRIDWGRALKGESFTTVHEVKGIVFETYYSPIRDEEGRTTGAMGVSTDVTSRQMAEEALRESELRFRRLADASIEGIIISRDGVVVDCNAAFCRMFGYKHEEAIGKNSIDFAPEKYHQKALEKIASNSEDVYEIEGLSKEGSLFPIEVLGRQVPLGGQLARVTIVRDITQQKRTREELLRAKDAAEKATQAKSEFLANVSHEIRTPLNAVLGLTELLALTRLDVQQGEYVETVKKSAHSLLSMINDLLDFSKIEAGRLELEHSTFNLRECVEHVGDLLAHRAHSMGLEFLIIVEPEVPTLVLGDAARLRQVLINLASNAIKFTTDGEVAIRISAQWRTEERCGLRFSVRDTGIGIPADRLDRLFKPFSQVDASTTRKFGGTGLGLAISRQLVEAMGGVIEIHSQVGRGSEFSFELVLDLCPEAFISDAVKRQDLLGGLRILVADSSVSNVRFLCETLEMWGCSALEARSGAQVMDLLVSANHNNSKSRFDLLIVNHHLTDMSFLDMASQVQAKVEGCPCPVMVMLSALDSGSDVALPAHCSYETIRKPIKKVQLFETIYRLTRRRETETMILPESPERVPAPQTPLPISGNGAHPSSRILLVEDNPVNQLVAEKMIKMLGYRCDKAANGVEALQALERRNYDLVLMDCQMPEMDGYEAARRIRLSSRSYAQVPIIAMTAHAMQGDRDRCLAAGMTDYLSKPITIEAFKSSLESHLNGKNQTGVSGITDTAGDSQKQSSGPPVDAQRLRIITDGDAAVMAELANVFLSDTRKKLAEMESCVQSGDSKGIRRIAHSIKGSAANFGANRFSEIAARMERAADEERLPSCERELSVLQSEFKRLVSYLETGTRDTVAN